jgi:hypothetical protein
MDDNLFDHYEERETSLLVDHCVASVLSFSPNKNKKNNNAQRPSSPFKKPLVVQRTGKKPQALSLFFQRTSLEEQKKCKKIDLKLGCTLMLDPVTLKIRVLHIPESALACHLFEATPEGDSRPLLCLEERYEEDIDCFILTLIPWTDGIKVTPLGVYEDSVIFDLQNGKLTRIEIICASDMLNLSEVLPSSK